MTKKNWEPRPSKIISVRLPAIVIDALAEQLPRECPSVNAWLSDVIHELIDVQKLTAHQKFEWQLTSRPLARAGRK